MYSNIDSTAASIDDSTNEVSFSLGPREFLFLATILFIGFCGFTVCVDKIYSVPESDQIQSITVHEKDLSMVVHSPRANYNGYIIE